MIDESTPTTLQARVGAASSMHWSGWPKPPGCRRVRLLAYFGEASGPCGNCDNCLNRRGMGRHGAAHRRVLVYRTGQASARGT